MKNIVLSIPNALLSEALARFLREKAGYCVYQEDNPQKLADMCAIVDADVLLCETRDYAPYTGEDWRDIYRAVKKRQAACRLALVVDEAAFPQAALRAQQARSDGVIDAFFFESVSCEYIAAVIDRL